ncbi:hypothetical protein V6N11_069378 [Hibiscus sabdariffa]|uniref:Uncharacterized protein n=2 Tax=Hibiscus sabdariffa TaxID=183260 RepID=A0ABR1Z848_9ROSI
MYPLGYWEGPNVTPVRVMRVPLTCGKLFMSKFNAKHIGIALPPSATINLGWFQRRENAHNMRYNGSMEDSGDMQDVPLTIHMDKRRKVEEINICK